MKLKELKKILYSLRGSTQYAVLYDSKKNADIDHGPVESIIERHSDKNVKHIEAFEHQLILTV